MVVHLLFPAIHLHLKKSFERLVHEDFLCSLECFFVAALLSCLAAAVSFIEKQQAMPKPFSLYTSTMELYRFALGTKPKETKQQKKERLRKEKQRKQKEARRKSQQNLPFVSIFQQPVWCILPPHRLEGLDFWIHMLKGNTFFEKRYSLLESIEKVKTPQKPTLGFSSTTGDKHRDEYLLKAQKVMSYLHENQQLRWKFKRFFTNCRVHLCSAVNETDPITMEPIEQPVSVYDFSKRKVYRFESKSIAKHIHKQLTRNDGQIPTPAPPRNPLTNQPFLLHHIIGILRQCKAYGHSSWVLEAFVSTRYDMTSFIAIHSKALRLQALKTSLSEEGSWDFVDTMTDFIKSQHVLHGKVYSKTTYEWALTHALREERMEKWKKLCLKWYEADILIDDTDTKDTFLGVIEDKTKVLCELPTELIELRNRRKSVRLAEQNGGGSA